MTGKRWCCALVLLVAMIMYLWYWYGLSFAKGDVTISVARIVSAVKDEYPDLQLEIEVKNESRFSEVYRKRHEAFVYQKFHFEYVGWEEALIFRIRDVSLEDKPIIALLATTPSRAASTYRQIYDMTPENNWLVMEVTWDETER